MIDLANVTSSDFQSLCNEEFSAAREGNNLATLRLIDIAEATPRDAAKRVPFTLTFRGPSDVDLVQAIYRLHNTAFGEIDIFLVPIGPDDQGLLYEAVFN